MGRRGGNILQKNSIIGFLILFTVKRSSGLCQGRVYTMCVRVPRDTFLHGWRQPKQICHNRHSSALVPFLGHREGKTGLMRPYLSLCHLYSPFRAFVESNCSCESLKYLRVYFKLADGMSSRIREDGTGWIQKPFTSTRDI